MRDFAATRHALAAEPDVFWGGAGAAARQPSLVVRSASRGAIQAVDVEGLVTLGAGARGRWSSSGTRSATSCPPGAKLIEVYGGDGDRLPARTRQLRDMVALGDERTIEQDPAFAIRIMVDIADKALSAAVNDPTTAVQVLDHLGDVLRLIGTARSVGGRGGTPSGRASTGVVIPVRRWEDYLTLAGHDRDPRVRARSIQVMRRMRAMLTSCTTRCSRATGPRSRTSWRGWTRPSPATFGDSVDIDRASVADAQGIGGRSGRRHRGPSRRERASAPRRRPP